jgi:hypothetical protein
MTVSQTQLALLYLYSILMGAAMGLLYDGFRISRIFLGEHFSELANRFEKVNLPLIGMPKKPRGRNKLREIFLFVGDFLFCIIASVTLILLFYQMNHGKLRFMTFVLCGGGFYLYRMTAGRLIMLCSETIAFVLQTAVRYVFFFVLFPWRWMMRKAFHFVKGIAKKTSDRRMKRARLRYTAQEIEGLESTVGRVLLKDEKRKGVRYRGRKEEAIQPEHIG